MSARLSRSDRVWVLMPPRKAFPPKWHWSIVKMAPFRFSGTSRDGGAAHISWAFVYADSTRIFTGRTRAEAMLRFRIAHPDSVVYEIPSGPETSYGTLEELSDSVKELSE